ncbi:DUF262 domain-containing protein [Acidithiobacillus sp. CV18-2]|uniref:DUF262 domain-containing protein n=1 Tax=Igneacidithiobacillus copahuensis TaxID=2724909 RepID=A0AAE3CKZ3_9PROT|nr:DUF262 domain-containing protein [Igneacidithiobacillus copahuensis]MBU2754169.1 DUF262 domain-containing protein [Acidithiobacillus sp. CV18-3]MBU2758476.1 DUF262 domain-containing protein [Acidithiobacillus sp. BN09-2]MBU2776749.1 DUF262 domain-containing protein [Acidithiobacillus sp. CV18-2]MBU2797073.1 DUF262 domain-containing protein [Acidithiobacillus sp. VAN18-2]MBU2798478.1 DUF262 domain-containing protein [Acidithiobacillus sp. VAN18-4]UTV80143.1 DUF262 domain-containing protein 
MNKGTSRTKILSLREIAWWWLGDPLFDHLLESEGSVWADLPAIQRGFVWNANKIERLWDSIATGFPIGSLMLQLQEEKNDKYQSSTDRKVGADDNLGSRQKKKKGEQQYFLLDGQQRATAIALGFKDVWTNPSTENQETGKKGWRALWVDIGQTLNDDRRFLFRLTSTAHPWGYRDDAAASEGPSRLSATAMREAHRAFKACLGNDRLKPHQVPAHIAFPWDAKAPVPVAFILQVLLDSPGASVVEVRNAVWEKVKSLRAVTCINNLSEEARRKFESVIMLLQESGEVDDVFAALVNGLRDGLATLELPAPVLHIQSTYCPEQRSAVREDIKDENDSAYNLFARINTAGTTLTREEINYSLLKSIWNGASDTIDKVLADHQITYPARLASLLTRLVLTEHPEKDKEPSVRNALSIAQFRKVIADNDSEDKKGNESNPTAQTENKFTEEVKELINSGIVAHLWRLLAEEASEWTLPPIIAADITRHNEELVLIVLLWLRKLKCAGLEEPAGKSWRRTLGFITAIHWFANDASVCASILGKLLLNTDADELKDFFDKKRFCELLDTENGKTAPMARLPSPDQFRVLLNSTEREPTYHKLWHLYFEKQEMNKQIEAFKSHNPDTAPKILEKMVSDRRLLMYAQRKFISTAFSWFDPTRVERVTDHNVPWDFDHIVPNSWFWGINREHTEKPNTMKIWKEANGNFRLWPAEANRSKGDSELLEDKLTDYELNGFEDIRNASAIPKNSVFCEIRGHDRAAFYKDSHKNFEIFRRTAIDRTIYIYQEWYEQLLIGELNGGIPGISDSE